MFKWLKKLFKRRSLEDIIREEEAFLQWRREQNALMEEAIGLQGQPQILIPHETPIVYEPQHDAYQVGMFANQQTQRLFNGQQQLAQQQMAAQEQRAFVEGTYGTLHQQHAWGGQGQIFRGMPIETIDTLFMELKANGMPEPDIKDKDLLGVEFIKLKNVATKLYDLYKKTGNKQYYYMGDIVKKFRKDDVVTYRGKWGFDEALGEYLVRTSWTETELPLSIFVKLPQTMEECIEVMEKGLWSSRKSPITKKDIQ